VEFDGTHILVNTVKGRCKERNMRERPLVGLDMVDPDNPLHWLSVRGKIAEITEERAFEHVKKLAKKYTGNDLLPPSQPDEVLVIVKITPVL